jgi:hypothetical protein
LAAAHGIEHGSLAGRVAKPNHQLAHAEPAHDGRWRLLSSGLL